MLPESCLAWQKMNFNTNSLYFFTTSCPALDRCTGRSTTSATPGSCMANKTAKHLLTVAFCTACIVTILTLVVLVDPVEVNVMFLVDSFYSGMTRHRTPISSSRGIMMKGSRYDVCVVGSGLSGAVISERYANQMNQSVLVLEKRKHFGGNCYDYVDDETGLRVNLYGAHLFHTNNKRVWDYVQTFSEWTPYEHKVLAAIDGKHVPVPVNIDTVNSLLGTDIRNSEQMSEWLRREQVPSSSPKNSEEMALSRVGQRLYEKLFKPYTIKQWSKTPAQLGPEVLARIPVRNNRDARYFSDTYQALPRHGYTHMFRNMLVHRLITVMTDVDYFDVRNSIECGRTYFTGPIDAYFAHLGWEKLEYRSLEFERKVIRNVGHFQPGAVVNHPSSHVKYTRIVEYKHFLNQSSPHTVVFYEYSKDGGDPYYPVPNPKNKALFAKYQAMAAKERGVTFVGRLANYKYFNMDESILNALELFDRDNNRTFTSNTQSNTQSMADVHIVTNVHYAPSVSLQDSVAGGEKAKKRVRDKKISTSEWTTTLCSMLPNVRIAWFVYDKSPVHAPMSPPSGGCVTTNVRNIHLPNVGREGHSWLQYMLVPENIGPINVFLQGNPEVDLQAVANAVLKPNPFLPLAKKTPAVHCGPDLRHAKGYFMHDFYRYDLTRLADALGVDLKKVCYHPRGEFVADGATIRRAVELWGDVIRKIVIPALETGNDPPMGHALERMWVTLLSRESGAAQRKSAQ
jgi:UDP-galactopyranose mutase